MDRPTCRAWSYLGRNRRRGRSEPDSAAGSLIGDPWPGRLVSVARAVESWQFGGATAHLVDDLNVRRADGMIFVLVTIISAIPRPVSGIGSPGMGASARVSHCAQVRTTPHHAYAHKVVNHDLR